MHSFDIDLSSLVLRITFKGQLTDAELRDAYSAYQGQARQIHPKTVIAVFTDVDTRSLSSHQLEQMARCSPAMEREAPRIIVADTDAAYGLARVFQAYASRSRDALHVVRTMEDAYKVVAVVSPQFQCLQKRTNCGIT